MIMLCIGIPLVSVLPEASRTRQRRDPSSFRPRWIPVLDGANGYVGVRKRIQAVFMTLVSVTRIPNGKELAEFQ